MALPELTICVLTYNRPGFLAETLRSIVAQTYRDFRLVVLDNASPTDLRPVVEKLAENFGLTVLSISDDAEPNWWVYATTWILLTKNKEFAAIESLREAADAPSSHKSSVLWTDDFASLYSIMK